MTGWAVPPGGDGADLIAGYIAAWQPSSVPPAAPRSRGRWQPGPGRGPGARANALLWAAARLAAFGIPLGLQPVPEVLLHPSVIERFAASAPGLSGSARRTLRTNLRFLARRVVPALAPVDAVLPRERAKAPYSLAEIAGVPGAGRRPADAVAADARGRAGLPGRRRWPYRADLRAVRGTDVACRSGGVIVAGPRRPAPGGPGPGPLPPAAARLRRSSPGPGWSPAGPAPAQEHHHPADPVAGRRDRAAPAGGRPAADDLAG